MHCALDRSMDAWGKTFDSVFMIKKHTRSFLPEDFILSTWDSVKVFYDDLLARPMNCADDLVRLLKDWSELAGVLEEDMSWRYIRTSCDTADMVAQERYEDFVKNIMPHLQVSVDALTRKVSSSPYVKTLEKDESFAILFKKMQYDLRCFREANIPIYTGISLNTQKYGAIVGAMTIEHNGQEMTLQQADVFLESHDRALRQVVFDKVWERRYRDKDELNKLYSALISQRHQIALNAGFENFRDYAFVSMHRFDYSPSDCFNLHSSIKEEVVPFLEVLARERKSKLGLDQIKPFDTAVDIEREEPLRPFVDADDMLQKAIIVFDKLHPYFGNWLRAMAQNGLLDLASRKGKAPGGYNCPLHERGASFIFMNAASTLKDMVTIFHEGGHAIHFSLVHDLMLNAFKECPSETAELASMSMELLTMPFWDVFFPDVQDLQRAKRQHLTDIVRRLAWIATIDAFQHWVYENPNHTHEERVENWNRIFDDFSNNVTDWSGYELAKSYLWQSQLHLFEVPFYYIEYAIAQLGALGIWKNAQTDPKRALECYMDGLKLGNTRSIANVYSACGTKFDFSRAHIRSLIQFIKDTLDTL